jgi:hypothetical protein
MNADVTDPHPGQNPGPADENVFRAVRDEVQHEIAHIQDPNVPLDSRQSDVLVQKHVNGLVVILFAMVLLALLAAIGGIYFYAHSHGAHRVGAMSELTRLVSRLPRAA